MKDDARKSSTMFNKKSKSKEPGKRYEDRTHAVESIGIIMDWHESART